MLARCLLTLIAGTFFVPPGALAQEQAPPSLWVEEAPTGASAGIFIVFEARCAVCHDNAALDLEARGPAREAMALLSPERIHEALTTGVMAANAKGLSDNQLVALAMFIAGRPFGDSASRSADAMPNRCPAPMTLDSPLGSPRWNGWSPDPTSNARFQPTAAAGLRAEQVPQLKLKWAFGFPDAVSALGPPTVVGGSVFVGSDNSMVYALNATSGCVHWSFEARTLVGSGVVIGEARGWPGVRYAAYFGDWKGRVYAVDAETGDGLWSTVVDDHPTGSKIRASPVLDHDSGRLYIPISSWEEVAGPNLHYECCTFQGSIAALDVATSQQRVREGARWDHRGGSHHQRSAGLEKGLRADRRVWHQ